MLQSEAALAGVRVIDLCDGLGAYCTKLFADMGADVIRVEPPGGAQDRNVPPYLHGESGVRWSIPFLFTNTNKRSVTLDLQRAEDRDILLRLIRTADVLVESQAPGFLDSIGLGPDELRKTHPALVYTSITHFGRTGPYKDYVGSDLIGQAAGGILYLSGEADGPPLKLAGDQAYMATSLYAAIATVMALYAAQAKGEGCHIDVSVQESVAHSLQNAPQMYDLEGIVPRRRGSQGDDAAEGVFPCKDGYVSLISPPNLGVSWPSLVKWMQEEGVSGADELTDERWTDLSWRRSPEAHRRFREIFAEFASGKTKRELCEQAIERRVVLAPINRISDVLQDPQLQHRQFWVALEHNELGKRLTYPGPPFRMSQTPWQLRRRAPLPGEDNDAIFNELGVSRTP